MEEESAGDTRENYCKFRKSLLELRLSLSLISDSV